MTQVLAFRFNIMQCDRCNRPAWLFGRRDPITNWEGWCAICNWHWRYHDANIVQAFKLLDKKINYECRVTVLDFLALEWQNAVEIRHKIYRQAHYIYFFRTLLTRDILIRRPNGVVSRVRKADCYRVEILDFLNPLWKLQLARVFKLMISFLESPVVISKRTQT